MKLTQAKYTELENELKLRETTMRTSIAKDIEIAKGFGDLSENAEYSAARDAQRQNEMEIDKIKIILRDAEVINTDDIDTNKVGIGTIVTVKDDKNNEKKYAIVSTLETSVLDEQVKAISDQSPIGRALLNLKVGDVGVANTPVGDKKYTIIKIEKSN